MKWLLLSIRPGSGRMITPPRALTASFLLLIVIGTAVLLIPGMSGPKGLSAVDALFTATSAVCVTGLVVVDTGLDFTLGGQLAIMVLIQLGGLGIMTFSVLFYRLVGREISLRDELAVRDSFSFSKSQDLGSLVRSVVLMTLAIEGLGALLLFTFLLGDYAPVRAAYLAVFHAVSAFCNAGFSHGLGGDSLTRYAGHWPINLVIMGLIVSGGIGFIALSEIFVHKTRLRRLSLHTKLVCLTSLVLILFGTAMFLLLEWDNVMAGRPFSDKLVISLFQSVTPRTAGFNTINYAHLANTTLLGTIFLMFVGGSPGSTAGGIKTATLAILVAMAVSRYRGFSRVNILRRTIPGGLVSRAVAVTLVSIATVGLSLALLLIIETGHLDHTQTRDAFLKLLFETVSAFGTVGLSMGATSGLTVWGKLIIITTMFLGRVGPLTVALALTRRARDTRSYNYGQEEVMIG